MTPVALGYIRRSVIQPGESTDSPDKQRSAIERVCTAKGWAVEWYIDAEEGKHYSGRSEEGRPAWQKLKRQLGRSDVVAVVVFALDRASRSPKDFFNLLDLLERHHVAVVSTTQPIDTSTAIGRAFVGMAMVIGALEAEMAGERGKANIAYRRAQGLHWGPVRYGYTRADHRHLLVDPTEAAIVRQVYSRYAAGHYSHGQLAAQLNAAGQRIRTQDGLLVPFNKKHIQEILSGHWTYRSFLVRGRARHGGWEHDEAHPPENVAPGEWEPILTEAQVQAALRVVRSRNHLRPGRDTRRCYVLVPLLVCGHCGQRLYGDTCYNNQNREYHYYRHEGPCPERSLIRAEPLEAEVLAAVRGLRFAATWPMEKVLADPVETPGLRELPGADAADLRRREAELRRVDDVYLAGGLTAAQWRERRAALVAELDRLQASAPSDIDREQVLALARQCGEQLQSATPEAQRAALGILFARLECRRSEGRWHVSQYVLREEFRPLVWDLTP